MNKKPSEPVFKPYVMHQDQLLPPSYDEIIEEGHLVRVVDKVIDRINTELLTRQYKGGGTTSYHPKMMLKVLVYAYTQKIYSSRRIAKALRENIHFMWLSGGNQPDFRTINEFRGSRMKGVIDEVFSQVVEYLVEAGYVKMENGYLDGTKIEANANKNKVVWAKRNENYQKRVEEQVKELLKKIEEENEAENKAYGDKDLEERGGESQEDINSERLQKRIDELNKRLREKTQGKKADQALKKLEKDCLPRLAKYEQQEKILAGRNSYAQTDPDASCMKMKEDRGAEKAWPKPAYNVQISTEEQFILDYSLHQRAGDSGCLVPHYDKMKHDLGRLPENSVADAAYGSEENYVYLEKQGIGNYVKYNTFYQDTHSYRKSEQIQRFKFKAEHFGYDPEKDEFICPAMKRLKYRNTVPHTSENGFQSDRRNYDCADCQDCPFRAQCTKAKGNRSIRISFQLLEYRKQARQNLTSEDGIRLRKKRSTDVETVFGIIKHNMGFRRFSLRGMEKVNMEWGLVSIAHNMKKLAAI